MEVDPRLLRSFVALAEEQSFGRASQRLHIAQPALSKQIRKLEEELGTQLVDRTTRPIGLTAAGAAVLDEAQLVLYHTARAAERGHRAARGELGRITVGTSIWAYTAIVPAVVRRLYARAPDVTLELFAAPPTEQLEQLRREQLDLSFVAFAEWLTAGRALKVEPLLREPMVAIVATDHRFAKRHSITLEELATEAFVCLSQALTPGLLDLQLAAFHERGAFPPQIREVPDPFALFSFIGAKIGVGLHMASLSNLNYPGVTFLPLEGDAPTASLLLVRRNDDDREVVHTFVETAQHVAQSFARPDTPPRPVPPRQDLPPR